MNGDVRENDDPLDFQPPRVSVLAHFSPEAGESVAYVLIRELIEHVDRPTSTSLQQQRIQFEDEVQLEWIMQIINHSFFLSMQSTREYETARAAVRIYLAWATGINMEPHPACPRPLVDNPVKYLRQILDALQALFLPRTMPTNDLQSYTLTNRQANEMRTILLALRNLYGRQTHVKKECRSELWQQALRFLMAVSDNLLRRPAWPDELSSVMAADLSEMLFDAWTQASLLGRIEPALYWRRLGDLACKWITFVPFVEWWARKLLSLTVVFSQKIYGLSHSHIVIHDEKLLSAAKGTDNNEQQGCRMLNETWHELVTLLGNPANFFDQAKQLCEKYSVDAHLQSYVMDQTSMAFFLAVNVYSKMVDIFFGDSSVSIDFHEPEELYAQWAEVNRSIHEDLSRSHQTQFHRFSNMSTNSSNHSNQYAPNINETNTGTLTHYSLAQVSTVPIGAVSLSQHKRSVYTSKHSSSRLSSRSIHAVSLQTDQLPDVQSSSNSTGPTMLRPGQYVWYIMKSNQLRTSKLQNESRPPTDALLEMFLPWLYRSALIPLSPENRKYSEDVISQRSLSSVDLDIPQQQQMLDNNAVNRRSFATSTASSSDISSPIASNNAHQAFGATLTASQLAEPSTIPSVDGVAAGRAAALGALCRIVCSKSSTERLSDDQLAQFLSVMHDALIERDRLVLCALIFHSTELFKLGLKGVEVLYPNFAMAIDLVLTESFKLRLNPSIHEIDMRHTCLRAMASIIAWPTTFGLEPIMFSNTSSSLHHGAQNLLEPGACYLDVRSRFIKNLVHTLRNESDSMNLQLALALSCQLCAECTLYDLQPNASTPAVARSQQQERKDSTLSASEDSSSPFVVSALKRIVSAICDNLCKSQWASELAITLAAFDCLNAIASEPKQVLFHKMELSIGSLIVSSLCRFVNAQLQKPPPLHSKDLHSSVVAAFQCLEVWLCAAPMLCEMESCIATVAQTVEFGMSGGNGLSVEEFKPASQRVYDAAESLQQTLFFSSAMDSLVDEHSVLKKLGDENLSLEKFQHFLIDKSTLLSLHDITDVDFISNGLPTLVMIARTPHRAAHASLIQLRPVSHDNKENFARESSPRTPATAPSNPSAQSVPSASEPRSPPHQKPFELVRDAFTPKCNLDATMQRQADESKEMHEVQDKLHTIRSRLAEGSGCAVGDRDSSNVWIQSSLGALLCQPPTPEDCVRRCNSIRVFLYDMGLINRSAFGNDLIALNTSANTSEFYSHLHQLVDCQPAKRYETVSMFYVRAGQHDATDILQNADSIRSLSAEFCLLISRLGQIRNTRHSKSRFWTGHFSTAFVIDSDDAGGNDKHHESSVRDAYRLDGTENCLWSGDAQLEIAYCLPTERTAAFNLQYMSEAGGKDDMTMRRESPRNFYYRNQKRSSIERSDSDDTSEFVTPSASKSQLLLSQEITYTITSNPSSVTRLTINTSDDERRSEPAETVLKRAQVSLGIAAAGALDHSIDKSSTPSLRLATVSASTAQSLCTFARKFSVSPQQKSMSSASVGDSQPKSLKTSHQPAVTQAQPLPNDLQSPTSSSGLLTKAPASTPTSTSSPSQLSFPNTAASIFYIKSFFKRRPLLQSQASTDSRGTTASLPVIPEPPMSPRFQTLSDVTDSDLDQMFPRVTRGSSAKGYTFSSTSSSLAPASRTGSSLTGEQMLKSELSHPPTSPASRTRSTSTLNSESSGSQQPHQKSAQPTMTANVDRQSNMSQSMAPLMNLRRSADQRILVVWLERVEDATQFPYEQLLPATDDGSRRFITKPQRSDLHIFFVHNFEPGLVCVHVESVWTKSGQTGPLVDGVVVSTYALPSLLRQTVANLTRRKTVEVDQPSNSYRRRQSILELAKKFATSVGYTEFLDRFITV